MYKVKLKNRMHILFAVAALFIIPTFFSYIGNNKSLESVFSNFTNAEDLGQYTINAVFDKETMSIRAKQNVVFKNTTERPLKYVYFHLYPNAFRSNKTTPFEEGAMSEVYPNGFDEGSIEIEGIYEGNKNASYKIKGEAGTNLRVKPKKEIQPGDSVEFVIDFSVKLPDAIGRMGYGDHTVNITNWYPIISVYDDTGWNLDPYYAIGDPFYSEVGNYMVNITVPRAYELATTGVIKNVLISQVTKTYNIEAENVRDFAIILSDKFQLKSETVGNTLVQSYTIKDKKADLAMKYSTDALMILSKIIGEYPYKQISVVASDFFFGGMEYPNLVMINQNMYEGEFDFSLEYVIAHEIAHQWWYGTVGSDQIDEPWLDEGLTEYSTLMYFESKYGAEVRDALYKAMMVNDYEELQKQANVDTHIGRDVTKFASLADYNTVVYSGGAMFINELREIMGEEDFLSGLREYYETYKFKNARTNDFYEIMQKNTLVDLQETFTKWLQKI